MYPPMDRRRDFLFLWVFLICSAPQILLLLSLLSLLLFSPHPRQCYCWSSCGRPNRFPKTFTSLGWGNGLWMRHHQAQPCVTRLPIRQRKKMRMSVVVVVIVVAVVVPALVGDVVAWRSPWMRKPRSWWWSCKCWTWWQVKMEKNQQRQQLHLNWNRLSAAYNGAALMRM